MYLFDMFWTTTPAQLGLLKQLLNAVPLLAPIQSDPVGASTTISVYNLIYFTEATPSGSSPSISALQLKLDLFPSCRVDASECVHVTGSVRTLSVELIGSNEFLCWWGLVWLGGLQGSCWAGSPKNT